MNKRFAWKTHEGTPLEGELLGFVSTSYSDKIYAMMLGDDGYIVSVDFNDLTLHHATR